MKRTLLLTLLAAVLIGVLLLWGPAACRSYFTSKTEIRVKEGQAKAGLESGEIAVGTVGKNNDDAKTIDDAVKGANNDIDKAPDGKSNDAALRAACRMRSYIDTEQCARLRAADSAKLEKGSPAR